jgi:hypothetical protein
MVVGGQRITVFPSTNSFGSNDGRWKYCIADEGDDDDDSAYFSDPCETAETAKYEALAFVDGGPSRHRSVTEKRIKLRLDAWETAIRDREQLTADISNLLTHEYLNITALRKPEKRIAERKAKRKSPSQK